MHGPPDFFRLTKRIHNMLHGMLVRRGLTARVPFEGVSRAVAAEAAGAMALGDVVVLEGRRCRRRW
jgi:hypothetical protein